MINCENVCTGLEKIGIESQIKTVVATTGIAGLTFRKIFFLQIPDYTAHENHSIGKVWVETELELEIELY